MTFPTKQRMVDILNLMNFRCSSYFGNSNNFVKIDKTERQGGGQNFRFKKKKANLYQLGKKVALHFRYIV